MGGTFTTSSTDSTNSCSSGDMMSSSSVSQLKQAIVSGDVDTVLSMGAVYERGRLYHVSILADQIVDRIRGETALFLAVRLGHYHLVPVLLTSSVGASVGRPQRSVFGKSSTGHHVAVRWLLRKVLVETHDCSESGHDDVTRTVDAGIVAVEQHRRLDGDANEPMNGGRSNGVDDVSKRHCDIILRNDKAEVVVVSHRTPGRRTVARDLRLGYNRRHYDCLRYIVRRLAERNFTPDDRPLNMNGDTAIILAVRNKMYSLVPDLLAAGFDACRCNYRGKTALDELIEALFPVAADDKESSDLNGNHYVRRHFSPIRRLRQEPCDGVVDDWSPDRLPVAMLTLLDAGAAKTSLSLGWFVLHCVHDVYIVRQLILNCFSDSEMSSLDGSCSSCSRLTDAHRRLFRLLLQTAVKFNQIDNAVLLLRRVASPASEASVTFWMSDATASEARRLLPGHSAVTWSTVSHLANSGRIGVVADRIIDGLPLPVGGALTLLRAAGRPEVIRRVVQELLRFVRCDDVYETGNAVEMFYPYSIMSQQTEDRRRLFSVLAAVGPELSSSVVQLLAT